jgi:Zn-dependent peptidase ImmA (M78 family)
MLSTRKDLARQALLKADEIRDKYDIEPESAVNVFDLCGERLNPPVLVRFSDIKSMEGFYLRQEKPEIWLGERPLVRRTFNCAHELGHHVFGHGSTMDELTADGASGRSFDPKEFLVDTFAGYLLMPRIAVMNAFRLRGWKAEDADPVHYFVVACSLGVGFETLVSHCHFSLNLLGESDYRQLDKTGLPAIRRAMLASHAPDRLLVVDTHHTLPTADTEVSTAILLPAGTVAENPTLADAIDTPPGRLFTAAQPGITRVFTPDGKWAAVIRVMQDNYRGLSRYRHFPREEDDDE